MLTRTFCHIQGVGRVTESLLWRQGCTDWDCYLSDPGKFKIGGAAREVMDGAVRRSAQALADGEHQYFAHKLGHAEAWRAWPEFRQKTVYLDIETDGGMGGQSVTVVGLYDGADFRALVKGEDLDDFPEIISRYSMIVTFFGTGFDIPVLQKRFKDVKFDHIHLDLCMAFKRLGVKGGLKKIEREFGIRREGGTDGLDGRDAIRLWREWMRGSERSRDLLVAYNREDVVNLERLCEVAYRRLHDQVLSSG